MTTEKTLLTADDLLKLQHDGRRLELLDGELIEMAPTGGRHGDVSANVTYELESYVRARDLGKVLSNAPGIIHRRNPDTVRAPDVCFFARDRVPPGGIPDGLLDLIPDFVVEVVSPSDSAADVQQKTEEWLRAGVRLVWALYPKTRSVVASRSLEAIRVYVENKTIDAEPILPGFTCPVADLFS